MPAPIMGWNLRDDEDALNPLEATLLDNWTPGAGGCDKRGGTLEFASGMGSGDIDTLAAFKVGANDKFLAAGNGNIYDITAGGTATSLASGFSENRWQHVVMNAKLGLVNGTDAPQEYDGSTVGAMTVSGPTVANLIGIQTFKSRSYFWEDGSQSFWYSAVNALGGALTEFPLSRVGSFGGNLKAMIQWTRDSGSGVDDLAVFVMESGEALVYQGSDPGDANDWALIGIYRIGPPIDARGVVKFGGDAIVMTEHGYQSLEITLTREEDDPAGDYSNKINPQLVADVANYKANIGWEATKFKNLLIFNVPYSATQYHQHVLNTHLKPSAWCRWRKLPARTFGVFQGKLYFGSTDGRVYQAETGNGDDGGGTLWNEEAGLWNVMTDNWDATTFENIVADARQAHSDLGAPGINKDIRYAQGLIRGTGNVALTFQIDADHRSRAIPAQLHTFVPDLRIWEAMDNNWEDEQTDWDEITELTASPRVAQAAQGYKVGARIYAQSREALKWVSTRFFFQQLRTF